MAILTAPFTPPSARSGHRRRALAPLLLVFLAAETGCSTSPDGIGANTGNAGEAGSAPVASGGGAVSTGNTVSSSGATSTVAGASSTAGLGGAGTPPVGVGGGTGGVTNPGTSGGSAGALARAGSTSSTGGASGGGGSSGAGNTGGGVDALGGSSSGGVSSSAGSGGEPNGGGASGGPSTSELADAYPCNGDASGYDVVVTGSGSNWSVTGGSGSAQSHSDLAAALGDAYGRLTANRTTRETVLVEGDGTIDASVQLKLPSYIVLNLCGTIEVTGTASGSDRSPFYARDRTDIDIPHAHITGNPQYGMFFRSVSRLHLGEILLEQNRDNSGIGIRIDNNPNGGGARVTDIRIDHATGVGTGSHVVETYGVDGLVVGRVDGTDTGECGLLLNDTANAEVGVVHCENCAEGTGYAAFRIANDAGKIGNDWPVGNIHVGEVYARNGGRGIFSVSGSGGLTIDRIDLADTGNNAILLQNCYNTTIAAVGGTVSNGDVVLSNDTDNTNAGTFEASSNVLLSHLTLSNASVSEAWCDLGDRGNRAQDITGGSVDMCF